MKKYFLGIDQGGSKTAALVCDADGSILGVTYGAGLSEKEQYAGIFDASEKACANAGLALDDIGAVCGWLSGADWDSDYPSMTKKLSETLFIADCTVINDCTAACRAGTSFADRAVVCAGTGLNIGVWGADGKKFLYGYFACVGHIINGAGSLGSMAFKTVMEAYVGVCEETMLTDLVLGHTGHSNAEQLLFETTTGKYNMTTKELAPYVTRAYAAGDREAKSIIEKFADETAKYVKAGIRRAGIQNREMDLVFSGGVFKKEGALAADRIYQLINESDPGEVNNCRINKIHARYEPVCGAALFLLDRIYGGKIPDEVNSNFEKSAKTHELIRNK
jgi:N-acetylglucosamine kinase-like BadF-type ATPase